MRRLLTIGVLLQAIIGLMAVALLVMFAQSARHAYERQRLAERTVTIVTSARDLFRGMQDIKIERALMREAFIAPGPIETGRMKQITA